MEIGLIRQIDINDEVRESYLSYAMSVIVSRALPDARDGLKPVQRRILYGMYDMGLRPDTSYKKSARVVGEVLGKYHPHGDQSVYDAMVRLAQDFSMRYTLVDGQGNFGSIDGDEAAAMRYTEARMSAMGHDILADIDKSTVDFGPNFDDSLKEPLVLPATIPNLLVNGSSGIAVGMATSIPPHNLGEVVDALAFMLDKWENLDDITVQDLMQFIKGPDFPTGGLIFRRKADSDESDVIASAYATGRGRITVRAKAHVEQMERNKSRIVITELPYQANKTNLLGRIADLHRDGRIEGLTDLRDESDRNGMRIIIETTRNVEPETILGQLFAQTPMQSTFSVSLLALVNGEPRVLTLKQALKVYLEHRLEIVRRRSEYDLEKAQQRAHILEGLLKAIDQLDAVIDTIRRSQTAESARNNLIKQFRFTEAQAQAILDMQLRRLAALERNKIKEEHKEKLALIKRLEQLLANPGLMRKLIKEELAAVKEKYADVRRTQIIDAADSKIITADSLLPDENVWVLVSEKGTIGRTPNRDMVKIPAKPTEQPLALLEANTQDVLYLFMTDGQTVGLPVYQLPQALGVGEGTHYADMTALNRKDQLAAAVVLSFDTNGYLFLTTLSGVVKRIRQEDLPGITSEPFTVMNVPENDSLGWVKATSGNDEVVLATAQGQLIRFKEDEVRPMGLPAGGVMGIKLAEDDGVVTMDVAQPDGYVWSITNTGMAKATLMSEYPLQGRHGQGVINAKLPADGSEVVTAVIGSIDTEVIITTTFGSTKQIKLREPVIGSRATKLREVMSLNGRNKVTGAVRLIGRLEQKEEERETAVPQQLALITESVTTTKKKK